MTRFHTSIPECRAEYPRSQKPKSELVAVKGLEIIKASAARHSRAYAHPDFVSGFDHSPITVPLLAVIILMATLADRPGLVLPFC